ncbi:hypothetical protein K443DRAFT_649220 [Laccaria amethystina LaAM-08-1]|uniref:Uncharacterized protein n=1 Tax=Laccaria amethystina LaAM-08-1 TaxID=1095629 RepID=A0A0C9WWU1_9AGAR|nr:hypothetical protein K443DRAFT_649220 [Laccaria amethystina LaAM-08-1]
MFLSRFILAFASVTYALHVPVDSNSCVYRSEHSPHPHARRSAAYGPTSRMSARQNICSQYGTPYDSTQYSYLAPTCINTGNGFCGPYCGGTLTPCSGACSAIPCGPAAQGCIPDIGKCISSDLELITLKWPAAVVAAILGILSEFQTCLKDVQNDTPLFTCLGQTCGQPGSSDLQTVECAVSCVVETGVPNSCLTFLGDATLFGIAATATVTSPEAAIVVMYVEAIQCLLKPC